MNGRPRQLPNQTNSLLALMAVGALLIISSQALGQGSLNGGMMWKRPPTTSFPLSCNAIRTANPSAASGIYTIDPDDAHGPCPPLSVYCDMTFNDGGWTLIAASNGVDTSGPVVQSLTSTTTAGILDATIVKPLAWRATSVRFTSGPLADGRYTISSASGVMSQLRAYKVLNVPSMVSVIPNTDWTGEASIMWFACAPSLGYDASLSQRIYHACGNFGGLHWLLAGGAKWTFNGSISNLNLWVK